MTVIPKGALLASCHAGLARTLLRLVLPGLALVLAAAITPVRAQEQGAPGPVSPAATADPAPAAPAKGAEPVSEAVRATLAPYGSFIDHPTYGEVWIPTAVPQDWRPYAACHWVNSRKYGWFYDDRTPWGLIIHHYGRWTHDAAMGWIWSPGSDFSPGWVVWRTGPDYVGWAPLPPDRDIQATGADAFNSGGFWTFIETRLFDRGCTGTAVAPAGRTAALLETTQPVTDVAFANGLWIAVLPRTVVGPLVDVDVTFRPWHASIASLLVKWNLIWNLWDVKTTVNVVDCQKRRPRRLPPQQASNGLLGVAPPAHEAPPARGTPRPGPACGDGAPADALGHCRSRPVIQVGPGALDPLGPVAIEDSPPEGPLLDEPLPPVLAGPILVPLPVPLPVPVRTPPRGPEGGGPGCEGRQTRQADGRCGRPGGRDPGTQATQTGPKPPTQATGNDRCLGLAGAAFRRCLAGGAAQTATAETPPARPVPLAPADPKPPAFQPPHRLPNVRPIVSNVPAPRPPAFRPPIPVRPVIRPTVRPPAVARPIFHPRPAFRPRPVFHPRPAFRPRPVFHPRPVFRPRPVFHPRPVFRPRPVFHARPVSRPAAHPRPQVRSRPVAVRRQVMRPAPHVSAPRGGGGGRRHR